MLTELIVFSEILICFSFNLYRLMTQMKRIEVLQGYFPSSTFHFSQVTFMSQDNFTISTRPFLTGDKHNRLQLLGENFPFWRSQAFQKVLLLRGWVWQAHKCSPNPVNPSMNTLVGPPTRLKSSTFRERSPGEHH